MNSTGANPTQRFEGDITFELDSGLTVRVPNDQYIVPFVTIERNSSRIFNESQREVLIGALGDQPATLGRYFLTAAYLMVDQDAGTFTLWQANPSGDTDLAAVTSQRSAAHCNDDPPPDRSSTGEEGKQSGLSGGAIAGVVIGVLALLAVIGLLFLFIQKRKRKRGTATATTIPQNVGPQEVHGNSSQKLPMSVTPSDLNSEHYRFNFDGSEVRQDLGIRNGSGGVYEMDGGGQS